MQTNRKTKSNDSLREERKEAGGGGRARVKKEIEEKNDEANIHAI